MKIADAMLSMRSLSDLRLGSEAVKRNDRNSSQETESLRAFDAQFLAQILKGFQPEGEDDLFDGGSAGRMYRDHYYDEIARVLAEKGGLGMTEQLKGHMGVAKREPREVLDTEQRDRGSES